MLNKLKTFLLLAILFPLQVSAQFKLTGTVFDNENEESLIEAHVFLTDLNQFTVTDNAGHFKFENLKKGIYSIKVTYVGYKTYNTDIKIIGDTKIDVELIRDSMMEDEVVVTASRIGEKTPLTYSEIDALELKKNNKGADLPYLLQNTPSLIITSDAGSGVGYTGMRIRGSDLTRINVTMNDIPVNDPESHQLYFVDLPDLASSIDNIQVQRGVGTSTNGAAAFGASLNIKTDGQSINPYATLNSAYGSFNTLKNTLNFSTGRNKNGFNFNGRISKISSDGYIDRAWSDLFSYQLSASWSNKNNFVKAMIMKGKEKTYQAWNGCPKDSVDNNPTYNPSGQMYDENGKFIGYYDNETDNYEQTYYQLHFAHNFTSNLTLNASAFLTRGIGYYENFKNDEAFVEYGLKPFVIANDTIEETNLVKQKWLDNYFYGINISLNQKIGKFDLIYGGSWNRYNGDHYGIINWAEYGIPLNYKWYSNTGDKDYYNAFVKTDFELNQHFNFYAEIQYRHINHDIKGIHDDLRDITQNHVFNFWNPKGGIFYTINNHNNMYFSVAYSNKEPNRDLYENSDEEQLKRVTNEKLLDYELGYSYRNSKININTNLFYMDYKDQLVLTGEINNVGESVVANVDKSYRLGIESTVNYKMNRFFALDFNIGLSQNKILNFINYVEVYDEEWNFIEQKETDLGTTDISFSPDVIAGLNLRFTPVKNLDLVLQGKYVSRQYLDNTSTKSRSLDPYFLSDIHVNYEWKQNIFKELEFSLSVNNIFNNRYCTNAWIYRAIVGGKEYIEDGYFPQAGINVMFGISIGI